MDESTIEEAYRLYYPMIRSKCRRIIGEVPRADDLAQEAFVRLWENRDRLRDREAMLAWLYRTATRLAIDAARRGRFELVGLVDEPGTGTGERTLAARIDARRFADTLDDAHLEVAILSHVDGMTQLEIAHVTNRSDRTVRRMLERVSTAFHASRRSA